MIAEATRWCILRTSAGRTLPLARSLDAAGFDVWAPIAVVQKRRGPARDRIDVDAPIMPTFVFARVGHLPDLLALAGSPINPHPPFSVFRHCNRIPIVGDREIQALRTEEGRAQLTRRKAERHVFAAGTTVSIPDGPFAGLSGVVEEEGNGRFAIVCFGEWRLKVATFLLQSDVTVVEQTKSITDAAA